MIPYKYFTPTRILLLVTFFGFSFSKIDAQDANAAGKAIFIAKCASCHTMGNDGATGPDLQGILSRWEGDKGRVEIFFIVVALTYEHVEVIDPVAAGVVYEDAHGTFVDHRV